MQIIEMVVGWIKLAEDVVEMAGFCELWNGRLGSIKAGDTLIRCVCISLWRRLCFKQFVSFSILTCGLSSSVCNINIQT
jgi:hypothetical protein